MKTISLFSGVGGMDLGLSRAGFEHVAFCEADSYRRQVLARHWPGVPIHDDVRTFEYEGQVDCLVGGFPCQDLSVAGKRKGLAGERSGLFYDFARIADRVVRPGGFLIVENVAGLLSSNNGNDMAVVLRTLSDLGFSVGYRTVDSQHFNVPQRRRRVFIFGVRSESELPVQVLALLEGSTGDSQTSGETGEEDSASFGQGVAGTLGKRIQRSHTELDGHGAYVNGYAPPRESNCNSEVEEGRRPSGRRMSEPRIAACLETTCHDYSRADNFNMILVDDD
jgi:DNA (cytosine-5)-methyltransferase 1